LGQERELGRHDCGDGVVGRGRLYEMVVKVCKRKLRVMVIGLEEEETDMIL
jgi:hypothetical protein